MPTVAQDIAAIEALLVRCGYKPTRVRPDGFTEWEHPKFDLGISRYWTRRDTREVRYGRKWSTSVVAPPIYA